MCKCHHECHHVSPEWHLTEAAVVWIHSQIPLPAIFNIAGGYVMLPPFTTPSTLKIHLCMYFILFFSLSVNAQPHSVRSAMANTHRSAAIPLLLMPRFASPVPPGCSSGSEATMCRTVCLSAEGMSHIFIQRWEDLKQTHSFRSMSEEVKILVLLQFSSFQKVFK